MAERSLSEQDWSFICKALKLHALLLENEAACSPVGTKPALYEAWLKEQAAQCRDYAETLGLAAFGICAPVPGARGLDL